MYLLVANSMMCLCAKNCENWLTVSEAIAIVKRATDERSELIYFTDVSKVFKKLHSMPLSCNVSVVEPTDFFLCSVSTMCTLYDDE